MVTYGFYNSVDHDRTYDAMQVSELFDGLIREGVYEFIGERFMVRALSGFQVSVGTGRAWYKHTWTKNDATLVLTLPAPPTLPDRYRSDAIVLDINSDIKVRENKITYIKGEESADSNPPHPTLASGTHHQVPLAYIKRVGREEEILQTNINYVVGQSPCPFVVSVIEQIDITDQVAQWNNAWDEWFAGKQDAITADTVSFHNTVTAAESSVNADKAAFKAYVTEQVSEFTVWMSDKKDGFDEWFANLKYVLDGDVAGHLYNMINELREDVIDYIDPYLDIEYGGTGNSDGYIRTGWMDKSYNIGKGSTAEGICTVASGEQAHAEGGGNYNVVSEGYYKELYREGGAINNVKSPAGSAFRTNDFFDISRSDNTFSFSLTLGRAFENEIVYSKTIDSSRSYLYKYKNNGTKYEVVSGGYKYKDSYEPSIRDFIDLDDSHIDYLKTYDASNLPKSILIRLKDTNTGSPRTPYVDILYSCNISQSSLITYDGPFFSINQTVENGQHTFSIHIKSDSEYPWFRTYYGIYYDDSQIIGQNPEISNDIIRISMSTTNSAYSYRDDNTLRLAYVGGSENAIQEPNPVPTTYNFELPTIASGNKSHAEGFGTVASGLNSHSEGRVTTASGEGAHAEGSETSATGDYSHSEGYNSTSEGHWSHAEGNTTEAEGTASHAEGANTLAKGAYSHAEGVNSKAMETNTHAGAGGLANLAGQFVHGNVGFGGYSIITVTTGNTYDVNNYSPGSANGVYFTLDASDTTQTEDLPIIRVPLYKYEDGEHMYGGDNNGMWLLFVHGTSYSNGSTSSAGFGIYAIQTSEGNPSTPSLLLGTDLLSIENGGRLFGYGDVVIKPKTTKKKLFCNIFKMV